MTWSSTEKGNKLKLHQGTDISVHIPAGSSYMNVCTIYTYSYIVTKKYHKVMKNCKKKQKKPKSIQIRHTHACIQ